MQSRSTLTLAFKARHAVRWATQLGVVMGFWGLGSFVAAAVGVSQLGGVFGMALLGLALCSGVLRVGQISLGANWLLAHMLLFFIPAVLAVLDHRELLGWIGLKLFGVIVLGTLVVMAATALSIEWCLRWSRRRQALRRLRLGASRQRGARHVA